MAENHAESILHLIGELTERAVSAEKSKALWYGEYNRVNKELEELKAERVEHHHTITSCSVRETEVMP